MNEGALRGSFYQINWTPLKADSGRVFYLAGFGFFIG